MSNKRFWTIAAALLLLIYLRNSALHAQVTIFPEKTQVLYSGIENPVKLISCAIDIRKLIITSPDAEIIRKPDSGIAILPKRAGMTEVVVRAINRRDTTVIERFQFRTRLIPPPTAYIGGRSSKDGSFTRIPLNVLKGQIGIGAGLQGFDFDIRYSITAFTLSILRVNGEWQEFSVRQSAYFTEPMRAALGKLQAGDRLVVTGIRADGPVIKDISLDPLLLLIE